MREKRNLSAGDLRTREQGEIWRTHRQDLTEPVAADDETPTQAAGGTSAAHTHEPSEAKFNLFNDNSRSKNKVTHYIN